MIEQRIVNGSQTELYINGGSNFLTQAGTVRRHVFTKRVLLADPADAALWCEVTPRQKQMLEEADEQWLEPSEEFIAMVKAAGEDFVDYNRETGCFELNGITDISANEMRQIYNLSVKEVRQDAAKLYVLSPTAWSMKQRTYLPVRLSYVENNLSQAFDNNKNVEVISFLPSANTTVRTQSGGLNRAFWECVNLKKILTPFDFLYRISDTADVFYHCYALEHIEIKTKHSFKIPDSPLLSYHSVSYMVTNAYNTTAITITVHADVYAKLTGDTDNAAAAALTADEAAAWQALVDAAAQKNITFTTPTT